MDETIKSQIVQRISGNAALSSFGELSDNFDGKKFYFDQEGQQLDGPGPEALFRVETHCLAPSLAAEAPMRIENSLKRIDIRIFRNVTGTKTEADTYSVHVATDGR